MYVLKFRIEVADICINIGYLYPTSLEQFCMINVKASEAGSNSSLLIFVLSQYADMFGWKSNLLVRHATTVMIWLQFVIPTGVINSNLN